MESTVERLFRVAIKPDLPRWEVVYSAGQAALALSALRSAEKVLKSKSSANGKKKAPASSPDKAKLEAVQAALRSCEAHVPGLVNHLDTLKKEYEGLEEVMPASEFPDVRFTCRPSMVD